MDRDPFDDDPIEVVRRWRDAGGQWSVLSSRPASVTVGLYRCDGGEEADRITSSDPRLLALFCSPEPF